MAVRIINEDAITALRDLPNESVHCCVTSPPYWGLRDYGVPPVVWGGDSDCDHRWGESLAKTAGGGQPSEKTRWQHVGRGPHGHPPSDAGMFCACCDAWRGCLGLEPTPMLYVNHIVHVFHEVRRVLRSDATLWLNLGDCYANDSKWGGSTGGKHSAALHGGTGIGRRRTSTGLPAKNMVGFPWLVAFALQADGWILRSDIIWAKPNPMPESVTDRPTKSHEYLFLLSKSQRYYYDAGSIREPASPQSEARYAYDFGGSKNKMLKSAGYRLRPIGKRTPKDGRNRRSVWTVPTQSFPDAHFATFPPKLVEPCIKAGCPLDGTVLDPFGGAGTTGLVADRLGRDAILIDINPDYCEMARARISDDSGMFSDVEISRGT